MRTYLVYLAGPMSGHSGGYCSWRTKEFEQYRRKDVVALDPMRGKDFLKDASSIETHYDHILGTPQFIIERDHNDVKICDLVFVNLLGAKRVSIGTMVELGWAMAYRKPIILVMEAMGNIHDHPMVTQTFHAHRAYDLLTGIGLLNLYLPSMEPVLQVSKARNNGMAKLTWKVVEKIRALAPSGEYSVAQLGAMFGVSPRQIRDIIALKAWKLADDTNMEHFQSAPLAVEAPEKCPACGQNWWNCLCTHDDL